MKRLAILLLLGIFLSTQLATLVQQYLRPVIHSLCYSRAAKRMLRSNDPDEQLILDIDVYQRSLTDKKELKLEGRMYDIRSVKFEKGKAVLLVRADHAEMRWLGWIDSIQEARDQAKKSGHDVLAFQWFFKLFHPHTGTIAIPDFFQPGLIQAGRFILVFPSGCSDKIVLPPEQGC